MKLIIPGEFTTLNSYTNTNRFNRYSGAKVKKQETERVAWILKKYKMKKVPDYRYKLIFNWYRKNTRTDPDNIAFSKKFILDGMVMVGFLTDDKWSNIRSFEDHFFVSKDNPRVEIFIT